MFIKALKELAEQEGLMEDPSFIQKPVAYLIKVGTNGEFKGFISTKYKSEDGKKTFAKEYQVPRSSVRSSNIVPAFLCDKPLYVLGIDLAQKYSKEKTIACNESFISLIYKAAEETKDEALIAVFTFLKNLYNKEIEISLPEDLSPADFVTFLYEPDIDSIVTQRPAVSSHLAKSKNLDDDKSEKQQCVVTGKNVVAARIHSKIKKLLPGEDVSLISFNTESSLHYGKMQCNNAPMSQYVTDAYTTGLNFLLKTPNRHIRFSQSEVVVFWLNSKQSEIVDIFSDAMQANEEAIACLYNAPWKGQKPSLENSSKFYALTLSARKGNAIIRSYIDTTVSDVFINIKKHFEDMKIVMPFDKKPTFSLKDIIRTTVLDRDDDKVNPALASNVFSSIVYGRQYPRMLFESCIRRTQIERKVLPIRMAIIKSYLKRANKEVTVNLDKENKNNEYQLGRLFATLEKLQEESETKATLRDSFFARASTNPVTVFPLIMRKTIHYYSKVKRRIFFETRVQEIMSKLNSENAFPSTLSLEQQGTFSLGYYQEKQDLFTKHKVNTEEISS